MNRLHPLSWIATSIVIAALCLGCQPKPAGGGGLGSPGVVSCASKSLADHAPQALGPVNSCLAGDTNIDACLLGLIQPAIGITVELVGCLTRREGSQASAASQANPADDTDAHRAARAKEFLGHMAERGFEFRD